MNVFTLCFEDMFPIDKYERVSWPNKASKKANTRIEYVAGVFSMAHYTSLPIPISDNLIIST